MQPSFHARYSALWRSYRYLILSQRARPAIWHGRVCWHHYPLNAARMHRAAQALLGEHDFSGYRAAGCQSKTPWRRVDDIAVRRRGPMVTIDIRANAFVHHMVRNIAGVLLTIGRGEAGEHWAAQVLASRDRIRGGVTAPAEGLYLREVGYPARFALPRPAPHPWRLGL
jgi:tRNA pseudouridine38-40 synthase